MTRAFGTKAFERDGSSSTLKVVGWACSVPAKVGMTRTAAGRRSDREELQGELSEGADRGVLSEGSVRPALRERGSDSGVE